MTPAPIGISPADVVRGYRLTGETTGRGETIALMAVGAVPDRSDLDVFWQAHGIVPPDVKVVRVGSGAAMKDDPLARFEITMNTQWAGAVSPGARLVIYVIEPGTFDPWASFLRAAVGAEGDDGPAPTVAVTTVSCPERQYYRAYGRKTFAELLERADVLGMTVLAAAGDWGAHGGFPRIPTSEGPICDPFEEQATFPGVEPGVLSVGGTQVRHLDPWRETAWSGPISQALAEVVGLERLAGSGGFSNVIPIPDWQKPLLRTHYSRGADYPAAMPRGRAQPDVSLMAWGPDVEGRPSSFATRFEGVWRDDAGGTSVAAPIWAGIVARLNEARRERGLTRLGCVNALFYRLAREAPHVFRAIEEGSTDMTLPGLDGSGRRRFFDVPGFRAEKGWNPATGLGVPDVAALERAIRSS